MASKRVNHHATAAVFASASGPRGALFTGPSGSGKTSLALGAINAWRATDHFAALVADDQVLLSATGGRLVASAPPVIAGKVELRCKGIVAADFEECAIIDMVFQLLPAAEIERMPEAANITLEGISLSLVALPADWPEHALMLIRDTLEAMD